MLISNLLIFLFLFIIGSEQQCVNVNEGVYFFEVTKWSAGCQRSCYYDFYIRGPAYNDVIPAFSAYCSGYSEGAPFYPCVLNDTQTPPPIVPDSKRRVAARLAATTQTGTGAHLVVSYQFSDLKQQNKVVNYTGYANTKYNQFVSPSLQFTIIPTQI